MALAPALDAADLVRSAEVVAVAILAQPPSLGGGLTGLPASGLATVVLAICGPRIRNEKLRATVAFASGLRLAHRELHLGDAPQGRKRKRRPERTRKRKKQEELYSEVREENPTEEEGISNRHLSSTFIPPLTARSDANKQQRRIDELLGKGGVATSREHRQRRDAYGCSGHGVR